MKLILSLSHNSGRAKTFSGGAKCPLLEKSLGIILLSRLCFCNGFIAAQQCINYQVTSDRLSHLINTQVIAMACQLIHQNQNLAYLDSLMMSSHGILLSFHLYYSTKSFMIILLKSPVKIVLHAPVNCTSEVASLTLPDPILRVLINQRL